MPSVACLNFPSISKELWTFLVSWPTLNQTRVMTPKPMFHMATTKAIWITIGKKVMAQVVTVVLIATVVLDMVLNLSLSIIIHYKFYQLNFIECIFKNPDFKIETNLAECKIMWTKMDTRPFLTHFFNGQFHQCSSRKGIMLSLWGKK